MRTKMLLVIPGLPRSGTTSLVNLLFNQKEVYRSRVKEPHSLIPNNKKQQLYGFSGKKRIPFFKLGFLDDYKDYLDNYGGFREEKIYIDGSTLYSVHNDFLGSLNKAEIPKVVKFIIMYRDPYERAVSHYRFSISRGEEHRTFREAVLQEVEQGDMNGWVLGGYVSGSSYKKLYKELMLNYSDNDVLFVNIDNENIYSEVFLDRLRRFLGIDRAFCADKVYENRSVIHSNALVSFLRIQAVKIRRASPLIFDRPVFRRLFTVMMTLALKTGADDDFRVDMERDEFINIFERYEGRL